MSDAAWRILLAAGAVVVVLAVVVLARLTDKRSVRNRVLLLEGLDGRVLFFSDSSCRRCDSVRRRLKKLKVDFREISHDVSPDLQREVGVGAVPLVVFRTTSGREAARLAGAASGRSIRKAMRSAEVGP